MFTHSLAKASQRQWHNQTSRSQQLLTVPPRSLLSLHSNLLSRFSKKNQLIVISPTSSLSARLRLISLFAQLASVVFSLPRSVEILLSSSSRLSSCSRGLSLHSTACSQIVSFISNCQLPEPLEQ